MLRLGPPYYEFEGVTVMGDAHDKQQYYYFPMQPHVPVDEEGRPAIRFITLQERPDEVEEGEDVASFLFFDTVLSWPEQTLTQVRRKLEDAIEDETGEAVEVRLAPLPYRRGGVRLTFLDETTKPVVLNPPEEGEEPATEPNPEAEPETVSAWVPFLTTSGVPSLFGENRAVFQAQLNRKATKLLLGAFEGLIPASVYYELEFVGQMQAYNIKVSADWEQVYEFIQNRFDGNFVFFEVEIDKMFSELEEQKIIKIEATLDATEADIDPAKLESEFNDVRNDLQDMVLKTFFEPTTNPHAVEPEGESSFDRTVDSLVRMRNLAHKWPSVGYSRREVDISEIRSIDADYTVHRAVTRRIAPQAHIHVFFEDLGVTRDDIVTVVRDVDELWESVDFSVSVVADFDGDGIDTVVVDVQYSDTFDPAPDTEANPDAQWSFLFKSADQVFRKSAWFNPDIGNNFFYRYRVFFKPDSLPGPSATAESPWRALQSQDIIANTRELFERERVTIEAVGQFPWNRYPQVLAKVRYDDPVSSWLHEEAKLLSTDGRVLETEFRQRAKDGISPEYQFHYIRNDGEVIETAWQTVGGPLTLVHNPDPPQLEVQFVVSPATRLGILILNLRYDDPPNGVFEDASFVFNAENAFQPQIWRVPWKDPSKRRFFMQQTIVDADGNVTDTGMVEAEGRTKVLGDVFAKKLEVQTKLIGPSLASQRVDKILLRLKYEDAANGVLSETLHEFFDVGDAPSWAVLLKDASKREYTWELTYQLDTGFTASSGVQIARDSFLLLSSKVPT
ncbi:MAG: hypothetical protein ACREXW_11495 [Gammaproteobacteria bacterium]